MNEDEFWDQVDEVMKRSIENSTRSIFDEYIKQNAANRASVGITAKIVRKMHSETCEWCRSLAGVYIYGQEPHEVYQRHDNCDCTVEYFCEKGRQNVWESNNKFIEENDYRKKERISYILGIDLNKIDKMGVPSNFKIKDEIVKAYKNNKYDKIYMQTYTKDSQNTAKIMNDKLRDNKNIEKIVIVKRKCICGISAYDHVKKELYICEELSNSNNFFKIVDRKYFPAKDINDVIIHECYGHASHWSSIYNYYKINNDKFINILDAKMDLENDLRKYVKDKISIDRKYILNNISKNAENCYILKSSLNELIADGMIKIHNNQLNDEKLVKLIIEVLKYDEYR